ncbi:MAG: glutamine synthetase [Deltaproteobacteria bacterium]|nr:MAG: glutamine synthetase [Deltaproteobacteria bacterium]
MNTNIFEYVWVDGCQPPGLRSKSLVTENLLPPFWTFDGSSTGQATQENSDLILVPVKQYMSPFSSTKLVLCDVYVQPDTPIKTSFRSKLKEICEKYENEEITVAVEQEYTMFRDGWVYGWAKNAYPELKSYYCGVGIDNAIGREIAEKHLDACLHAGVRISGINAETMLSQWEYQIGPADPVTVADDLWMSRYILKRIAENYGIQISFDPKPIDGWSGSGCHINFSTKKLAKLVAAQNKDKITETDIKEITDRLKEHHDTLLKYYGWNNERRLTGKHETCHFAKFKVGIADRTASIRIPLTTHLKKTAHIEDRRPAANMGAYRAFYALISVIMGEKP